MRAATIDRLGGAQHIVEEHLEGAMAKLTAEQKDVAARIFNHLVTPSGTKIAHEVPDLADFGQVSEDELAPVLSTLSERRILRSVDEGGATRYEIFHDVLAQPVLAWRAEHEAERELEPSEGGVRPSSSTPSRPHRGLAVLLVAMGGVTLYALTQRSEAREQARVAKANGLVVNADAELDRDPELSLLLALEAARRVSGERVRAVAAASAARIAGAQASSTSARRCWTPRRAETSSLRSPRTGTFVVTHADGGVVDTIPTGVAATDASFAADGTALVTGRDGRVRIVREAASSRSSRASTTRARRRSRRMGRSRSSSSPVERGSSSRTSGRTLHTYRHPGARSAAISPDNRRVLTGGADDRVRVWSGQSGRRVHTLTEHDRECGRRRVQPRRRVGRERERGRHGAYLEVE